MKKSLKDMLVGVILGDASITKTLMTNKATISFGQSKDKIGYVNYLHDLLVKDGIAITKNSIKERSALDIRYNKLNYSLYFSTQSLEILRPLADLFLDETGKKIVPKNISDHFTPRSLAFWIMDDGQHVHRGGITLCTDCFNSEEIDNLREALTKNFDLETTIHNKKGKNGAYYKRIYIKKDSFENFKHLLVPHMHESMLYKIKWKI